MPDLNKLIHHVSDALERREEPPAQPELLNLIQAHAGVLALTEGSPYSPAQIEEALRCLQTEFTTRMGLGTLFQAEDYRPWLAAAQGDIDPYYWTRYRKHLRREGLSKQVVGTLDRVTDEILDHLENPKKDGQWDRKGLVVGHVQSGKTANYTGLVAKAADAGYKVIIVLAGMLNSLRNQTQERIDSDFMGWCTVRNRPIGAASFDASRRPVCFTTAKEDFKKHTATSIAMQLAALREPVLLVLKKNPSTLANLHEWLSGNNRHDLKDFPMLLIDDEADHASINTNKPDSDPTTINRWIRDVLALFPRCSFVGYTATPFANIFIDPDTEDEMTKGDVYRDLFPRDFILSLDPPSNYVGAAQLFLEEGNLDCIRGISDHEDLLPTGHKITFVPQALPMSLIQAIDAFVIARAIRLLRGQAGKHHSMMINVSRFTGVQNIIADLVLAQVKLSRQAIGNYAALTPEAALQNSVISRICDTWKKEYLTAGVTWLQVQAHLKEAIDPVEVISINTKGSGILDYSRENYPNGRSLIAVGGLSLSRGLTLQGLMATYFLRNSIMYDTLMQMGRWFGYRDGYADLCRIHMTPQTSSWYSHIAEAIEELRSDFKDMKAARMTPLEFGLRVRSHPTALIVTARNKMRASREIPVSIALEGRLAETSVLLAGEPARQQNIRVLEALVKAASAIRAPEPHALGWLWRGGPSSLAKAVVSGFQNHPECILTYREPLLEYITWLEEDQKMKTFDVLLRTTGHGDLQVGELRIQPIERTVASATENRIEFTKRRVASRGDERAGLTAEEIAGIKSSYAAANPGTDVPDKEYRKFRQQNNRPPLLMAMFVAVSVKKDLKPTTVVPAYGIGFPGDPGSQRRARKLVQYRVNTVWWQNNVLTADEEEDSE
jgi:hypothetical protein